MMLLRAGIDVDAKVETSNSILKYAVRKGYVEGVRILNGAGVDCVPGMWSALWQAISQGSVDLVRVLLAAEIDAKHIIKEHVFEFRAISLNDIDQASEHIIQLLVMSGVDCRPALQDNMIPVVVSTIFTEVMTSKLYAEQQAGEQDWKAQEVIDFGVLRVIFGDKFDNQITKQDQEAHTHRGAIQRLIAHLADPLQSEDIDSDIGENASLRACVQAKIELNRERRLLAQCREELQAQGVRISLNYAGK